MTIHVHKLGGCAPAPLAHYLKALGILRLVSEQKDPKARGWWDGEQFQLATHLSFMDIQQFFLYEYSPTPMLAPWNGASGFFKTWDKEKRQLRDSKSYKSLDQVRQSTDQRWERTRAALAVAVDSLREVATRRNVSEMSDKERENMLIIPDGEGPIFPVADKDNDKLKIQSILQKNLNQELFYRSAVIDMGGDKPAYPSIWGSGGNDGAMDFTARYLENLLLVFAPESQNSATWLNGALTGNPISGLLSGSKGKVGQFLPSGAGGANSVNGVGTQNDTQLNPWDFALMLEGAVCLTSHVSRQSELHPSRAATPFAVGARSAAYASASAVEDAKKGEQWMPLWSRPLSYIELRRLLGEGRAQVGKKPLREPLDLARAAKSLGTARGIKTFQRYGYLTRNGKANLAVPLGKLNVADHRVEHLHCIKDLDLWLHHLHLRREAGDRNAPARLIQATKNLDDLLIAATEHPHRPDHWQLILKCLADVEQIISQGSGFNAGPIPKLSPGWISASCDSSSDFRLALAFALQVGPDNWNQRKSVDAPIRRHWLPLDSRQVRFKTSSSSEKKLELAADADVVMHGRDGLRDAIALVQRRIIEGAQRSHRYLPLMLAPQASWASASTSDLSELLAGRLDLNRINALARAFMALDRKQWRGTPVRLSSPPLDHWPDEAWLAIRLCTLPWKLETRSGFVLDIGTDPAIVRRLAAGDAASAITIALRRLAAAGVRCTVRAGAVAPNIAMLWAAALAFPISQRTAGRFLQRLDPSKRSNHVN